MRLVSLPTEQKVFRLYCQKRNIGKTTFVSGHPHPHPAKYQEAKGKQIQSFRVALLYLLCPQYEALKCQIQKVVRYEKPSVSSGRFW